MYLVPFEPHRSPLSNGTTATQPLTLLTPHRPFECPPRKRRSKKQFFHASYSLPPSHLNIHSHIMNLVPFEPHRSPLSIDTTATQPLPLPTPHRTFECPPRKRRIYFRYCYASSSLPPSHLNTHRHTIIFTPFEPPRSPLSNGTTTTQPLPLLTPHRTFECPAGSDGAASSGMRKSTLTGCSPACGGLPSSICG
jgi:hypothetical protein